MSKPRTFQPKLPTSREGDPMKFLLQVRFNGADNVIAELPDGDSRR